MTVERPCDCAGHHMRFPERSVDSMTYWLLHPPSRPCVVARAIPAMHQHEDERCGPAFGTTGCPGLPHCRDWIIGCYRVGEYLCTVTGDHLGAFERRVVREELEREFARRQPLQGEMPGDTRLEPYR